MSPLKALQERHQPPSRERAALGAWEELTQSAEAVLAYTAEKGWHGLPSPPDWWREALEA